MLTLTDISARTDVWLSVTAVKGADVTNVSYDEEYNSILAKSVSMPVKEGTVCYIGVGVYGMITEDAAYEVTVSIDGEYVTNGTANAPHSAVVGENTVTVPVFEEVFYVYNATANGTLALSSEVTGIDWFATTDIEAYEGVLSLEVAEGDKVYIRITYAHDYENDVEFVFNVAFEGEETAEDIVNAAYELAEGASLPEKKTLTGVIVSVDDAYNTQFSNVTVTIIVGDMYDKPIQCYRIKGTGADTIKVGDTITVSGTIKNYYGTIEFDAGSTLDAVDTTTALNDNHKLYLESENVEIKNAVVNDGDTITLPAAGTTYTDVTVSWVSDNACAVIADGRELCLHSAGFLIEFARGSFIRRLPRLDLPADELPVPAERLPLRPLPEEILLPPADDPANYFDRLLDVRYRLFCFFHSSFLSC